MRIITGTLPNSVNYKRGRSSNIEYIVIHYTANKGDTAANNIRYFADNAVKASAHYFVDENSVYTSVPAADTAHHCGGGLQGKSGHAWFGYCKNSNSIGVEMCLLDRSGNIKRETIDMCAELTRFLMQKYGIPPENVLRHWDVTGKSCPAPMVGDKNAEWTEFKRKIADKEELNMEELKKLQERLAEAERQLDELKKARPVIYNYIDKNMPDWARTAVRAAVDKGVIKGDENGLGLTYADLRAVVREYRLGLYD